MSFLIDGILDHGKYPLGYWLPQSADSKRGFVPGVETTERRHFEAYSNHLVNECLLGRL